LKPSGAVLSMRGARLCNRNNLNLQDLLEQAVALGAHSPEVDDYLAESLRGLSQEKPPRD
jgi:hypothetical protein